MDKINEGITGAEASNIIYGNDTFLRTLNNDEALVLGDGVRANRSKAFNIITPEYGYSVVGAIISPTYHPVLRVQSTTGGNVKVIAVKGSEQVAEITETLIIGDNYIDTKPLGNIDARVFIVPEVGAIRYSNDPQFTCYEYNIATGAIAIAPYDMSIFVLPIDLPALPKREVVAYPSSAHKFGKVATGVDDYAIGYEKEFTAWDDVEALDFFAAVPTALAILYVKVSDFSIMKTLNLNARTGWNNINLIDWIDLEQPVEPYYILVQSKGGALAYSEDYTAESIQKQISTNSGKEYAAAMPSFRMILKGCLGLSEQAARGAWQGNGADDAYSYYYADCKINSRTRLKAVNVYCIDAGAVYIDFYAPSSVGYAAVGVSGYANYTGEYFECVKGWNRIEGIKVPNFIGDAFVMVRSNSGVLAYQAPITGRTVFEKSGNNPPQAVPYRFAYNIETYDFDIDALASGLKDVTLPTGTIEFSNPITLRNQTWRGRGTADTWLRYTGTTGYAVTLIKAELKDVTLIGQSTIKASVPTLFPTLEDVQTLAGLNSAGTNGLRMTTSPCSVDNVRILDFDYIGFENNAAPNGSGAPSRTVHNLIGRVDVTGCGIGFNIPQAGEYSPMALVHASNCGIGIYIGAGNVFVSASTFNDNAVGLYMYRAGSDSHGSFTACNWNHSKQFAIIMDNNRHGENFVGCHVFEGKIYLHRSTGFTWTGGIIDAPIYAKGGIGTQSLTYTAFQSAYWNKADGIHHNFEGETSYLKMHGNYFMFETGADDGILNNV